MKSLALLIFFAAFSGQGIEVRLSDFGRPFTPPQGTVIEWQQSATNIPPRVSVYERQYTRFPPEVITECMKLGGWTLKDRRNVPGAPPNPDTNFLFFPHADGIGRLGIDPERGIIDYLDERAHAPISGHAKEIPSDAQATDLARSFLKKLRIDEKQLVHNKDGTIRAYGARDVKGRGGVEEVITRSVYFTRAINGISMNGMGQNGGIWFTFGDHGKVSELRVVWPELKPIEEHTPASLTEIQSRIKNGKAILVFGDATTAIEARTDSLRKLIVKEATPMYRGGNGFDLDKTIVPYLSLTIVAELPNTNYQVVANCSIFTEREKE